MNILHFWFGLRVDYMLCQESLTQWYKNGTCMMKVNMVEKTQRFEFK